MKFNYNELGSLKSTAISQSSPSQCHQPVIFQSSEVILYSFNVKLVNQTIFNHNLVSNLKDLIFKQEIEEKEVIIIDGYYIRDH